MLPEIIQVLQCEDGHATLERIYAYMKNILPASTPWEVRQSVQDGLNAGTNCGLVLKTEKGFKLGVNLHKPESAQFVSALETLQQEIQERKSLPAGEPDEAVAGSSRFVDRNSGSGMRPPAQRQTIATNRRRNEPIVVATGRSTPAECGPGWRRRPLAQRQAIAISRRRQAEQRAREIIRSRRQGRSPARRGSRSRSRSRSSRRRSRSRARSRSRSRSRG
ncbi:serine/arginine repetitive matrix protein 2-like [Toxorhynchites rutilus septentrionalis]|uniref:serine/arginine repetitive matrix protein 2-like n=1 Tax=Toxorhynchites rutilus septentrionalis TaxID=329112 RepID=UPI00247ACFD8|nr:serine/arginine repetitive matrix protein 2-like [Toxorhynchites rutilus septentrionalis]